MKWDFMYTKNVLINGQVDYTADILKQNGKVT